MSTTPIAFPVAKKDATPAAECCARCRFALSVPPGGALLCRRFPPTLALVPVPVAPPNGVLPRRGEPQAMAMQSRPMQPWVTANDWCAEFKA